LNMKQMLPGGPKPASEPTKRRKTSLNKGKGLGLVLFPRALSAKARVEKAVKSPR
jgi:hypothetical protein